MQAAAPPRRCLKQVFYSNIQPSQWGGFPLRLQTHRRYNQTKNPKSRAVTPVLFYRILIQEPNANRSTMAAAWFGTTPFCYKQSRRPTEVKRFIATFLPLQPSLFLDHSSKWRNQPGELPSKRFVVASAAFKPFATLHIVTTSEIETGANGRWLHRS